MFAALAALVFAVELFFDPDTKVSLVVLGLTLLSLHFVFGPVWKRTWQGH